MPSLCADAPQVRRISMVILIAHIVALIIVVALLEMWGERGVGESVAQMWSTERKITDNIDMSAGASVAYSLPRTAHLQRWRWKRIDSPHQICALAWISVVSRRHVCLPFFLAEGASKVAYILRADLRAREMMDRAEDPNVL